MGERKFIYESKSLPSWNNPISHAVVANNMCFVSGQLSVGLDGKYIAGTMKEESKRAFRNFFAAVEAAGFSKEDIAFVDIAFCDLNFLHEVNELFISLFPENKRPARTVYEVSALPFGGKIKVMGTAVKTD